MHFDKSENKLDKLLNKKEVNDNHYKVMRRSATIVKGNSRICTLQRLFCIWIGHGLCEGMYSFNFRMQPPTPLSGGQGPRMLLKHFPLLIAVLNIQHLSGCLSSVYWL